MFTGDKNISGLARWKINIFRWNEWGKFCNKLRNERLIGLVCGYDYMIYEFGDEKMC